MTGAAPSCSRAARQAFIQLHGLRRIGAVAHTAKVATAAQPTMSTGTASLPSGMRRLARSGLQGSTTTPSSPIGTSRQLKVGLQPARAASARARGETGGAGTPGGDRPAASRGRQEIPLRPKILASLRNRLLRKRSSTLPQPRSPWPGGVGVYVGVGATEAPASTSCCSTAARRPPRTSREKGHAGSTSLGHRSCVTCVGEMPKVIATHDKYKAVLLDNAGGWRVAPRFPAQQLRHELRRDAQAALQGRVIDNTGKVAQAWGDVQLTLTTYLVNKRGEIAGAGRRRSTSTSCTS